MGDALRRALFTDPSTDDEFTRLGCVVRPFLDAQQVRAMTQLNADLVPDGGADFSATTLHDNAAHRWRVFEAIRAVTADRLREMMPRHTLVFAAFVSKRARTTHGRVPLHQDFWMVDNRMDPAVAFWCPLVDAGPHNGGLKTVPGVHRLLNHPYPINPKFRTPYHPRLSQLDREFARCPYVPAGSALIYDQRMLHGSDENLSDHARIAFNCTLVPGSQQLRLYDWDERSPERMLVFDVDQPVLCRFRYGAALDPRTDPGVRLEGQIASTVDPLTDDDMTFLRDVQRERV